jgi:hypothetical protein
MADFLSRIETKLRSLVEGGLERLPGGRLAAASIAAAISRALETSLQLDHANKPWAADSYKLRMHPEDLQALQQENPNLTAELEQAILQATRDGGYSLLAAPTVEFETDEQLKRKSVDVQADHSRPLLDHTQQMPLLQEGDIPQGAVHAYLVSADGRAYALDCEIINIGRLPDNHIVLSDPRVSRRHAQIRLREGYHMIFDMSSLAGIQVNGEPVTEHMLQHGDVITFPGDRFKYRIHETAPSQVQSNGSET